MAGTNKREAFIHSRPAIILRNPQLPENIGMVARSMVNYGFSDLRIVNPKVSWPNKKSYLASAGAFNIISEKTKVYKKLASAFSDIDILFATSVRVRELDNIVLCPREAINKINNKYKDLNVGFLFGPEKSGLSNSDLSEANYIIQIPTNPNFGSLNLAMAVNIICYEWYFSKNFKEKIIYANNEYEVADKKKLYHFKKFLIDTLCEIDFFKEKEHGVKLKVNVKNIFSKITLTNKELLILYGVIKSLKKYKNK